jgi:hypothetical protein
VETKICSKCNIEKFLGDFPKDKNRNDGHYVYCKQCRKLTYQANSNLIKEKSRNYYNDNKEKNHAKILQPNRFWIKNNPTYTTEIKKIDPKFKMIKNVRRRLNRFIRSSKLTKRNTTIHLIGCTPDELKTYIENKFDNNMSWENQGMWHIDHIIPLSSAKTEDDLIKLCHYTNLQPLWAKDNLRKSNKLDYLYIMDNPII